MSINNNYKWYMVASISGKEESVIESLKRRAIKENIKEIRDFFVAIVPHITPSGKKRNRNLFPGYIFIEMIMTNEIWFVIRNTQDVTGLVGSSGQRTKPTPISHEEIEKIQKRVKLLIEEFGKTGELPFKIEVAVNDKIVVIKGPMQGEIGQLIELNEKTNKGIIEIEVFGKKVPTQISLRNIAKIKED